MMRATALALVLLGAAIVSASGIPADVRAGFYPGRSGDLLLKQTADDKDGDVFSVFVDSTNQQYFKHGAGNAEPLSATNFADVVTRLLGAHPVNEEFNADFLQTSYFNRPKANLLVAVESVGADTVWRNNLHNLKQLSSVGESRPIQYAAYPMSSLPVATTLTSGHYPAAHGIVARKWQSEGKTVSAFSKAGQSNVANIADRVTQTFSGKSLTVSVSADPQLADAFCVNPALSAAHPEWNNYCVHYADTMFSASGPHSSTLQLQFEEGKIARKEHAASLIGPQFDGLSGVTVTANKRDKTVTVAYSTHDGDKEAVFDLSVPEDFSLFAELHYALSLPSWLSASGFTPLVRDNIPDAYHVAFSSLTGLIEKYGRESSKFIAAARLVDSAVPQLIERFAALYPNALASEIVLLGSHESTLTRTDNRQALSSLSRTVSAAQNLKEFLPNIYLPAGSQTQKSCEAAQAQLSSTGFNVYCPHTSATSTQLLTLNQEFYPQASYSSNYTNPTYTEIQRYQIALWTAVLLIGSLAVVVYCTIYMDIRKDSILYGNFNPNWEDRKKGR